MELSLYKHYNNNYYIHWVIFGILYIITIVFAVRECKEKFNAIENYTDIDGSKWHYQFYPNMDSLGGNLYQKPDQIGNVNTLKKTCQDDSQCRGFNSNAYFKKFISSQDQWTNSLKNTEGGLYLKLPGVRRDSQYPEIPFLGTHMKY